MTLSAWLDRLRGPRLDAPLFWVMDLETTGLRPDQDHVISVAAVPIREGIIRYHERWVSLVRPPVDGALPGEGVRAHHLLPADLAGAPSLTSVLLEIDARLREGVVVLHYASLDLAFLREAYRAAGRPWLKPKVIDTIDLLLELHHRRHLLEPHPRPPRTALAEARADLGLPPHESHDALSDALATAELFLVLRDRLAGQHSAPLR